MAQNIFGALPWKSGFRYKHKIKPTSAASVVLAQTMSVHRIGITGNLSIQWRDSMINTNVKSAGTHTERTFDVITTRDYQRFNKVLISVINNGENLHVETEKIFNQFCKKILRELGSLKWSSLVEISDAGHPLQRERSLICENAQIKSKIRSLINKGIPEKAALYDLFDPTTPMFLRMLQDYAQEVAIIPVRLERFKGLWIVGSNEPRYIEKFGFENLAVAPHMLEIIASAREHAQRDPLTGLPNRTFLHYCLTEARSRSVRKKNQMAVSLLDLDGFKMINDTYGHKAGDWILQEITSRWKKVLRSSDTLLRLGGDEFIILIEDLKSINDLNRLMKRVHAQAAELFVYNGHKIQLDVSAGITIFPHDTGDNDILLDHADQALYWAKSSKSKRQRCYFLYSDVNSSVAS